ncbi:hypothetical protein DY037_00325 [Apilactobacillus micheneri]|uniref:Uncharacterized protein n=1 Tax=Apilactobacillus micheneri TaxID=1899430 RepID=A0A9Q8MU54_9LACO|nr:hypothetical protein DY114_00525 [Apilactobacillus micheneri]TPR26969.1 hypothetical protein DY111_00525 [Apilactobacillus micheneri]TPR27827.1 hypothetical protein DY113_04300 [Apilactobacillus micheneri]TPR31732.1 hypothetical protein DY117_00525 [Apilactobacillus micheneri]TPR32136.1 hypothetical protein DY120_00525 [Apilactobacillus micheneri]
MKHTILKVILINAFTLLLITIMALLHDKGLLLNALVAFLVFRLCLIQLNFQSSNCYVCLSHNEQKVYAIIYAIAIVCYLLLIEFY